MLCDYIASETTYTVFPGEYSWIPRTGYRLQKGIGDEREKLSGIDLFLISALFSNFCVAPFTLQFTKQMKFGYSFALI